MRARAYLWYEYQGQRDQRANVDGHGQEQKGAVDLGAYEDGHWCGDECENHNVVDGQGDVFGVVESLDVGIARPVAQVESEHEHDALDAE